MLVAATDLRECCLQPPGSIANMMCYLLDIANLLMLASYCNSAGWMTIPPYSMHVMAMRAVRGLLVPQ
jgi:hypothetical protein